MRSVTLGAVTCMALMACGDSGSSSVTDSAGIAITTSTAPTWGEPPEWTIDSTPLLAIGDARDSAAVLLIGVTGVRLLGDGRIAVVSNDEKAVLYFDEQGRPAGRTGRVGQQPGEFRQVILAGARHDSLLLWDYELDRATVVDPGGRVDRTFGFTATDTSARYGFGPAGWFDDGSILVAGRIGARTGEASGVRRDPVPLRRASGTGVVGDSIGTVPGNEQFVVATGRYVSSMERAFGRRSVIGVRGTSTLVATGDRDEVMVFDRRGRLDALWRIARPARAIDPKDTTVLALRQRAQMSQLPPEFAAAMRRAIDSTGLPAALPPYDQMVVDETGATWLRDDVGPIRRDTAASRWTVIDGKGRWLGSVVTPARFVVHQVTRDRIAGVWTDPDGVEQVHLYRLHR